MVEQQQIGLNKVLPTHMNTIGFVVEMSPNGPSLSEVIDCCSARHLAVFARGGVGCDVPPPSFQTSEAMPNADLESRNQRERSEPSD